MPTPETPFGRRNGPLVRTGATIENSAENRAYLDLRSERIILAQKEQLPAGTRAGLLPDPVYELVRWTGHPSRLNRAILMKGINEGFASPHCEREKLQAEIMSRSVRRPGEAGP